MLAKVRFYYLIPLSLRGIVESRLYVLYSESLHYYVKYWIFRLLVNDTILQAAVDSTLNIEGGCVSGLTHDWSVLFMQHRLIINLLLGVEKVLFTKVLGNWYTWAYWYVREKHAWVFHRHCRERRSCRSLVWTPYMKRWKPGPAAAGAPLIHYWSSMCIKGPSENGLPQVLWFGWFLVLLWPTLIPVCFSSAHLSVLAVCLSTHLLSLSVLVPQFHLYCWILLLWPCCLTLHPQR